MGLSNLDVNGITAYHKYLLENGFKTSIVNPSIFFKRTPEGRVIASLYVDDTTIFGDKKAKDAAKEILSKRFEMKDLGKLSNCIGIQVEYTSNGVLVHQTAFCEKLLQEFRMENAYPRRNPLEVRSLDPKKDIYRAKDEGEPLLPASIPYSSAIGALIYLASPARPDISFHVNLLARNTHAPTRRHWSGVKQILRYLRGTTNFGLFYRRGEFKNHSPQRCRLFIRLEVREVTNWICHHCWRNAIRLEVNKAAPYCNFNRLRRIDRCI